jgi:hypothetical protein
MDSDCITMKRLRQVNVIHAYMISHTILPTIVTLHKKNEIKMKDGSEPKHKFTNLCWEVMWLTDNLKRHLFNGIIPVESGYNKGSAIITYCTDNKEAAVLVKKIKRCPAGWFFGYWQQIKIYRLEMVQKLMESFDVDEALLVRFTEFDPATLILKTRFGDVDEQLERVETNPGINQGWYVDLEDKETGTRVDVVGHHKALEMTLRNRIEDVDNAYRSGPS